ncbi:MAG: methyltransferase domain-containing protein [Candidatus Hydrogenedentes bacterium]|nr:methyltransferase domain-containing protein [Candidatus Hydrogenedentota bacterium]
MAVQPEIEQATGPTADARRRANRVRTEPAPAFQRMVELEILKPKDQILCYGCGSGADVAWLKLRKFSVTGYDPFPQWGYDTLPTGLYDHVFMIYLMTRLKSEENRRATIAKAFQYVRPGGYLTIVSRNWFRIAAEAGYCGREEAILSLSCLLDGLECESVAEAALAGSDGSVTLTARKSGVYQPRLPVDLVVDQRELEYVCTRLAGHRCIGLDVETTLEEPRILCTVQLSEPGHTWIIDALAMQDLAPLKALMENEAVTKIIHNALFEEQVLGRYGMKIRNVFDTLPASRKKYKKGVDGNHKLDDVCERELGIFMDKGQQTSDWTVRPLTDAQIAYAAIDAEVLLPLYEVFNPPPPPENLALFPEDMF